MDRKRAEKGHVFIQIPGKHVCVNLPKRAGAQVCLANPTWNMKKGHLMDQMNFERACVWARASLFPALYS